MDIQAKIEEQQRLINDATEAAVEATTFTLVKGPERTADEIEKAFALSDAIKKLEALGKKNDGRIIIYLEEASIAIDADIESSQSRSIGSSHLVDAIIAIAAEVAP